MTKIRTLSAPWPCWSAIRLETGGTGNSNRPEPSVIDLHEVFEPTISAHHGRLVKLMGDGLLVEFHSVVDAVRCAADVQHIEVERNADRQPDRRLEFRMAINLGDVIVEGDDIQGDGVNIADRLQGLAEPGGICIAANVHEQAKNKLDFAFPSMLRWHSKRSRTFLSRNGARGWPTNTTPIGNVSLTDCAAPASQNSILSRRFVHLGAAASVLLVPISLPEVEPGLQRIGPYDRAVVGEVDEFIGIGVVDGPIWP